MAIVFQTPSEIADEYLLNLKALKPEVNVDQTDSDWWIRGQVVGGVVSGIYQDQRKIADDAFPQSARREAVQRHLSTYFDRDFNPATQSDGNVLFSGLDGSPLPANTEFLHQATQNVYRSTTAVTLDGTTGAVPVLSVDAGQSQNLLEGTELLISSPPAGINSAASVYGGDLADGKNEETVEEAVAAILAFIRDPIRGGTASDYEFWAVSADPSVNSSTTIRYPFGFGTVGVYITAGTSDIDAAVDAGDAIVRIPSETLIQQVQDYIDALNPVTDCLTVLAPNEIEQDVEVKVTYQPGYTGATILGGQTLTLNQLVQREVGRVLYKLPTGGRIINGNGYVVASEIEENIDLKLSALPYTEGEIAQVIIDRQVQDLTITGTNRLLQSNEIVKPGTITVTEV